MTLEAILAAGQVQAAAPAAERIPGLAPQRPDGPGFGAMVQAGLNEVNGQLLAAQADMQRLAVGDVQNLHQVMIRLEESRLSFELMLQVRNRVLEAYQDLMKMQV